MSAEGHSTDAISIDDGETLCAQFRYAGVHPDGGSRLCECGLKYDEHRPAAQERAVEPRVLRDSWGLRIVHCHNDRPHGWHGWVGGNEDLRCPGVATYKDGRRV